MPKRFRYLPDLLIDGMLIVYAVVGSHYQFSLLAWVVGAIVYIGFANLLRRAWRARTP